MIATSHAFRRRHRKRQIGELPHFRPVFIPYNTLEHSLLLKFTELRSKAYDQSHLRNNYRKRVGENSIEGSNDIKFPTTIYIGKICDEQDACFHLG